MPNIPETWRAEQTVNATTASTQFLPTVIQLTNGNIVVAWASNATTGAASPAGTDIIAQIFNPLGEKVGGEFRLNNASTLDDETTPQLAALPGGGFVVVYHDVDIGGGGGSNIRLEEFDANGAQVSDNPSVVLDTGTGGDPNYAEPRVAASSDTSVLVVYESITAGVETIVGKIYDPSANTYGSQFTILSSAGGIDNAEVAVLANGNYVIAANYGAADNAIAYRIVSSTGANVLGATFVTGTDSDGFNDREVSVTALTGGGFVLAWTNTDAADTDILFRIYNSAGTQIGSGQTQVGSATNLSNEPSVVALESGGFVIVFDDDEANTQVVEHFSSAGASLGLFTYAGAGTTPVGVSLADGRFASVWSNSAGEISLEILDTRDAPNSASLYSNNARIGTVGDDSTNFGSGLSQTLYGWDGNDSIAGLAGNDTVIGGLGQDSVDGGAGNDVVYFDPLDSLANVVGGADFDTLFAVSGQNPFGFNLTAQGFEQGLIYYVDAGANPWTNSYQYYRPGWVVEYQDTYYDDGTRQVQYSDWQSNQSWSQYTDYYDAMGQLVARQTVFDDTHIENQFFDLPPNDPFASYIDFYNTGGQLVARQTINDDASYQSTFFDLSGNSWSQYTDFNNTTGQLIARQTINDDSSYSNTYFDPVPPNANSWAQYTDFFTAGGVFIGRTGINDDGTTF
jgi:hypothetical protein